MLEKQHNTGERVDPRTKRTHQLIVRAFGELLEEKSFEQITVQDITERATVNRATFYAHFEDKYDLMERSFSEMVHDGIRKKLPPNSAFTPANLQILIQTICEFLHELHARCAPSLRHQFDSMLEQQVKQQVYEILLGWFNQINAGAKTDAKRAGLQANAELQATVTSWAIYGAAMHWSQGERKESASEFALQALPMVMATIQSRP